MGLVIGFDGTAAARQSAGIGRYVRGLLRALSDRRDDHEYRVYYCARGARQGWLPDLDGRFRVRPVPVSDRLINVVWHRWRLPLPAQLLIGPFDLFHSPDFTLPPVLGKPAVVTIHDLAFLRAPECAYPTLRAYLTAVVPRSARRASRIITDSESTRRDVMDLLDISGDRVSTVHFGIDDVFRPPADREAARACIRHLGVDGPYILSVGTLEPRKNYVRLLDAYARLRDRGVSQRLVIAGTPGWLYDPIFQRMRELRLQDCVTVLRPDDTTLAALYGLADAFVFPSLYEGFGIPPLEALACGAPVACSATSSLPEIVGDVALSFDPEDVEQIEAAVWRLLSDTELRSDLVRRGPARAAQFSWRRAAERTVDVYEEITADA